MIAPPPPTWPSRASLSAAALRIAAIEFSHALAVCVCVRPTPYAARGHDTPDTLPASMQALRAIPAHGHAPHTVAGDLGIAMDRSRESVTRRKTTLRRAPARVACPPGQNLKVPTRFASLALFLKYRHFSTITSHTPALTPSLYGSRAGRGRLRAWAQPPPAMRRAAAASSSAWSNLGTLSAIEISNAAA